MCDHKCEMKCRRSMLDEPVNIKYLKRYITDNARRPAVERVPVTRRERIAVVGGGPSGMSAARELALRGYGVTVYEELPEAGGMLWWGIPEYRLPRDILKAEIEAILALGVELRCNTRVGRDVSWQELKGGFDAIYLAIGAHKSMRLGVEGEELRGVSGAVEFLREVNLGRRPQLGRRVAVIGGGNSAIDAARTARRLGAEEVTILYRRLRPDMPAQEEEIKAAEEEGVRIEYLVAPIRFTGDNGTLEEVVCQRMTLGDFDASGRRRPVPIPGEEFSIRADRALVAIGQMPDADFLSALGEVSVSKGGLIQLLPGTKSRASEAMVFAGGDAVTGPDTVIGAIAAGRRAAREIDEAIRTRNGEPPYVPPPEEEIEVPLLIDEEVQPKARACMPEVSVRERIQDFREVELGFSPEIAAEEATRCLRCDYKEG